jgi:hypothetical protein
MNIEEKARYFLESGDLNWRLGLDIFKQLNKPKDATLSLDILKRTLEIKPKLIKLLKIKQQDLISITERHSQFYLDDDQKSIREFNVKNIQNINDLDLFIFSIFSEELQGKVANKITKNSKIFGLGSCFAVNFINYIANLGHHANSSVLAEDINSPKNNKLLLQYIFQNKNSRFANLLKSSKSEFNSIDFEFIKTSIENSSHIVLTLGSAYHLIDTQILSSDNVVLKPHQGTVTVLSEFNEIKENIEEIIDIIKEVNPNVTIFLTVSPIPLKGIMHHQSAIVANHLSKSILRSAAHFIHRENCIYLPIYDVVNVAGLYSNEALFGLDDGNARHLNGRVIKSIMQNLEQFVIDK